MESTLVYVIRGLPADLETGISSALADYLDNLGNPRFNRDTGPLLGQLEAASKLMAPLPQYDVADFDRIDILKEIDVLKEPTLPGHRELWMQLLHALDDRHSGLFARLKALSPYAGQYMMFFDITNNARTLVAELDDELAAELLRRADAHQFPGNCYGAVVPPEALDLMSFVDAVDDLPTTA